MKTFTTSERNRSKPMSYVSTACGNKTSVHHASICEAMSPIRELKKGKEWRLETGGRREGGGGGEEGK